MKPQQALEGPGPGFLVTPQCITQIVTHFQFLTLDPLALDADLAYQRGSW